MRGPIVNLDEIRRAHQHFLAANQRMIVEAADRAGDHAEEHVQRYATFKRRTGKLQDATRHRVVRTRGGHLLRIQNPAKYAAAIDSGARPHRIVARRAKALRFIGRAGGIVFRQAINHPGNKPYKFLYRATNAAYRVLGADLAKHMTELAARF